MTDFNTVVKNYKAYIEDQGYSVSDLRAQIHVESIYDWSVMGALKSVKDWFLQQQANCAMTITDIPLNECRGWIIDPQTGWMSHQSGEFFVVQGVRIGLTEDREVGASGWDQPMVTQVGFDGGLLGILRKSIKNVPHYLVEAKAEPGNPDKVQLSPTLQATFSNLKQAHGGSKPRFSCFFENPGANQGTILFDQWMSEDGGRLHLKRNKGMLVEIPESMVIDIPSTFRWVSMYQLKELIKQNSWVNPHIRGIISSL